MRREEGISSIGFKNIKVTDLLKKFGWVMYSESWVECKKMVTWCTDDSFKKFSCKGIDSNSKQWAINYRNQARLKPVDLKDIRTQTIPHVAVLSSRKWMSSRER
jgi:hypothetical protein